MRIAIITDETDTQLVGFGNYTLNLVEHILKTDKGNEYYLIHRRKEKHSIYSMANEIIIPAGKKLSFIRNFLGLPLKLKEYNFDLVHHLSSIGPFVFKSLMPGKKNVQSVLDIIPSLYPEVFEWQVRTTFRFLLPRIVKNADHILTISETSKQDIMRRFGVAEDKVSVTYPACSADIFRPKKDFKLLEKYGLQDGYLLFAGALEAKKNILTLLRAFSKLKEKGHKHKLALVGKQGYGYNKILSEIKKLGIQNDIVETGYVPIGELPALYSTAKTLVLPSIYEGFGIPVVEANLCGCPVIISGGGSLPEVAGPSALIVKNPFDIQGFADAMEAVITNASLRQRMRKKGFENAKRFSWEKAAKQTINVYKLLEES